MNNSSSRLIGSITDTSMSSDIKDDTYLCSSKNTIAEFLKMAQVQSCFIRNYYLPDFKGKNDNSFRLLPQEKKELLSGIIHFFDQHPQLQCSIDNVDKPKYDPITGEPEPGAPWVLFDEMFSVYMQLPDSSLFWYTLEYDINSTPEVLGLKITFSYSSRGRFELYCYLPQQETKEFFNIYDGIIIKAYKRYKHEHWYPLK